MPTDPTAHFDSPRWWRECEAWFLALLVAAIYFARMGDFPLAGEETRRALIAREMIETGDWIVPRTQGQVLADRPPMQNWLIALSMLALGNDGPVAMRLHSGLAVIATSLVVYAFARGFQSRAGALGSGLAFATFGQVLQLGRTAESEATMTLFVAASLLVWRIGYSRSWPLWATWTVGYTLAALATLTKGAQGPVYFIGGTLVYLAWRRDWRTIFCAGHLLGVLAGAAIVAAWQIPYMRAVEWSEVSRTWSEQASNRYQFDRPLIVFGHLATYPLEALACMLPWSILLIAFVDRRFRAAVGPAKHNLLFLLTVLAVAFPSCWFAPGAVTRYVMPLYPLVAPLIGLVIDRAALVATIRPPLAYAGFFLRGMAGLMTLSALAAVLVAIGGGWIGLSPPPVAGRLIAFAAVASAAAVVVWISSRRHDHRPALGAFSLAVFLGATYAGPIVNQIIRTSPQTPEAIVRIREQIPPGAQLVSLNHAHHLFTYLYREPIELVPWPEEGGELPPRAEYFCFQADRGDAPPRIPFDWELLGEISCDRARRDPPDRRMIVGRVVRDRETTTESASASVIETPRTSSDRR